MCRGYIKTQYHTLFFRGTIGQETNHLVLNIYLKTGTVQQPYEDIKSKLNQLSSKPLSFMWDVDPSYQSIQYPIASNLGV